MKQIVFLFFFTVQIYCLSAQIASPYDAEVDSLLTYLENNYHNRLSRLSCDTLKGRLLPIVSENFGKVNPNTCIEYGIAKYHHICVSTFGTPYRGEILYAQRETTVLDKKTSKVFGKLIYDKTVGTLQSPVTVGDRQYTQLVCYTLWNTAYVSYAPYVKIFVFE